MRLPHNYIDNFRNAVDEHREGHNVPTLPAVAQSELEDGRVCLELRDLVLGQLEKDDAFWYKVVGIGHGAVRQHRVEIGGGRDVGG